MIQGGGFTLSCAIGVEGFKFSLWASASFRLRLEELINKRHFAGSRFKDKHLKSPSILLKIIAGHQQKDRFGEPNFSA